MLDLTAFVQIKLKHRHKNMKTYGKLSVHFSSLRRVVIFGLLHRVRKPRR